ncbi:MBG domain-containing protein, partial [Flavobacterium sp. W22_SRS_FK3]|uniref:MBG domain-containing protein n=1 Tax=Flavobacterium sp. W22_SRS_FK3 TaxID=3240275 RepID=UPI003F926F68
TNYAITYAPADFTITAKAITVTADAKTKVYGTADPVLTYSVVPGLETGDAFTGSLSRATGNSVGTYAIASSLINTNYAITYAPADFTITAKAITVTADAKTKVYGTADPVLTYSVVPGLETGDAFTGSLSRATGNSVGTYAIASSLINTNYAITYAPADFTITTKAITVTADAKTKVYGTADPVLTYSVVPGLETGDTFTGSLSRATGNNVGTYAIASSLNNTNYAITYEPADFTITKADQQITWNQTLGSGCDGETTTILTATSSSGLDVSYTSSNANTVTISNGSLVFENYGSANITAAQAGDNNYNAAQVVVLPIVNSQPNLIKQQFADVIFFDNSSNEFKSYAWYKNGVLVSGQNLQYYKETGGLNGTYYAVATKIDGTVITTCPLILSSSVVAENVKIVPNPVRSNASFELVTTVEGSKMQNAKISIFAVNGALVQNISTNESTTTLQAPTVEGIYIITLTLSNGSYFTKNLLVKN